MELHTPIPLLQEYEGALYSITITGILNVRAQRRTARFLAALFPERRYEEIVISLTHLPMLLASELSVEAAMLLKQRLESCGASTLIERAEDVEELYSFEEDLHEEKSSSVEEEDDLPEVELSMADTEELILRSPVSLMGWGMPPVLEESETAYVYARTGKRDRVR